MTVNIKITAPVYKANEYETFDRKADIQISGNFDSFSEGYTFLRTQVDKLLKESNAENTLLLNLHDLKREIDNKERTLKRLNGKIETAKNQLQRLKSFLERLGIDSGSYSLLIANGPIGSAVAVEAEVDPILFDSADSDNNPREF